MHDFCLSIHKEASHKTETETVPSHTRGSSTIIALEGNSVVR